MSEDVSMWSYWRRKRGGVKETLESDYPELLANDPVLQQAAAQIRVGELAIEARMQELEDEADD